MQDTVIGQVLQILKYKVYLIKYFQANILKLFVKFNKIVIIHNTTTVLWPFVRDYPSEPVPE